MSKIKAQCLPTQNTPIPLSPIPYNPLHSSIFWPLASIFLFLPTAITEFTHSAGFPAKPLRPHILLFSSALSASHSNSLSLILLPWLNPFNTFSKLTKWSVGPSAGRGRPSGQAHPHRQPLLLPPLHLSVHSEDMRCQVSVPSRISAHAAISRMCFPLV